ncbi:BREX system ATP-binding domain-containing protein [Clostridium cochlearium]|uniref:ATP-binding protein n=1 Tax=Clostridium cochlearium TaxID=1494 RepID=A0ABY0QMG1_CLOCO|nr:BREX system ATP-binding domain-containing protein [Clostridium cochlearium]NME94794.1 DUF2791 family P-loop domain-containing protein [Clostridium cochlearium]SDL25923.1 P-loop protein of unknown function [Clostridium cochlearium]SNV79104.1 P-loop Domain of uncharacterised function (DUF2791) [Clostridium cochlearium]STA92730.1 P-loop Domain of uncharacterised function (DUF2791) [Clostridium cochlearium]
MDKINAEKILYALKNGVVPNVNLDILCVGRDNELKEFDRCMDFVENGNGVIKFITGNYGSGKSFLLNVIKQNALNRNFIVAKIQIDKSLKFNKLEQVYYNIMSNLSITNSKTDGTSFEDIFNIWTNNLKNIYDNKKAGEIINNVIEEVSNYSSSFAVVFKNFIKAKVNKDMDLNYAISAWIKGEKNIPASVKSKFGVKSDIDKDNALQILRAFTKLIKLLGYAGIIILVDEMELIVNERKDIRRNSYENIRMLMDMSSEGELRNIMFVFAGTNELFENEEKGIKTYAALHNRLKNSHEMLNKTYRDLRQPVIKIGGLYIDDIKELTEKIIGIHSFVYNWQIPSNRETIEKYVKLSCSKFGDDISQTNSREYLKKLVDILDIMEQNPGVDLLLEEVNSLIKVKEKIDEEEEAYNLDIDDYDIEDEIIEL